MGVLRSIDRIFNGSVSPLSADESGGNPYEGYRIGRKRGAILRSFSNRGWLVFGFEEAQALFKDTRFSSDVRTNKFLSGVIRAASNGRRVSLLDEPTMLNQDPPVHTRLRTPVARTFTPQRVSALVPQFEALADSLTELIDNFEFDEIMRLTTIAMEQ